MTHETFSEVDWHEAIRQQISKQVNSKVHHCSFAPCPEQAYYVVAARDAGVQWRDIMSYCKSRGWEGSETTLLKFYRQQKKGK